MLFLNLSYMDSWDFFLMDYCTSFSVSGLVMSDATYSLSFFCPCCIASIKCIVLYLTFRISKIWILKTGYIRMKCPTKQQRILWLCDWGGTYERSSGKWICGWFYFELEAILQYQM